MAALSGGGGDWLTLKRTVSHRSKDTRNTDLLALAVDLLGDILRAPPTDIDSSVKNALGRVGRFCGADRAYVFRNQAVQRDTRADRFHAWCADGPFCNLHCNQHPAEHLLALWHGTLWRNRAIEIADVGALCDCSAQKAILQLRGVWSVLAVPMRTAGQLTGFVGFETLQRRRREFDPDEIQLLSSVADAIGAALARAEATAELAAARTHMSEAHDRLKTTLGALQELVVEVDANGRYVAVHTADQGQMMVRAEDLIGKTHEDVMPPDIAALNRRAMAEVDATGRSGPHHFWADTLRGRRRYAVTVTPRPPDRPGELSGYVFVARDVTEEWRLAAEAERLGLIARRMTDLVMIIGLDSRIEWVNPAFEARTGWTLDEVRGRRPPDFLHAPGTDRAETARIAAEMDAGRATKAELLNQTRDGEEFWTEIDLQPLRDADGKLTGFVSIETDITERKAQAAALEALAQDATEARKRLEMAVEALPDAFAFFDADNRLVLCNSRYRASFPSVARITRPGVTFEEVVRCLAESGDVPEIAGREAEWIAERLQHHHAASASLEQQMAGRWIRMIERATPDGGRVGMRIDITALKEAERRLADIIQGAEAGTWEWHINTGANIINDRWAEIVGHTLQDLAPLTIDVWHRLVHPEDLDIAEARLARVFGGELDRFEYELRMRHKDGHWVWVMSRGRVSRWSPDGTPEVMAGVHIDITALKRAEARLEEIIDAASAGTWEFDRVTDTKRVNERWAEMLGYTRAELADRPHFGFRELVHPEDLAILDMQEKTLLAAGQDAFANEIRMQHKQGHWVHVLSRGRVIARDKDDRPLKLAGIHLDITERMQLEAQLTAERDYLASLMDTSVSGITALNAKGRIIFANRGAERILGLAATEIDGMCFDESRWGIAALDGGPFPPDALPFTRVMAEGRVVRDVRFSIRQPDGSRRVLSVNAAPINSEGLDVRVVCSINDITDQVAAENDLREAAARAEAASRAKSLFLANMSHEIRTPLNGVLGMAQLLEAELSDPGHLGMLATIRASGETLLGVLNDVLDMSKIEAGKLALEQVPFVPADLVHQVESIHKVTAEEKGLALALDIGAAARRHRLGDPGRLAQILHNLVGNAVKFTRSGKVSVTLDAGADDALELVVRDTGIGMTAEQVARVFEEFEQADGTVTRRFGGTGLGMSIVKRLVSLMQGDITLDSTPGLGTEVHVRLPLPFAPSLPAAPRAAPVPSLLGLRVLAADDNRTNRTIMGGLMARLGVDIVLAENGRDALDKWQAGRFDLYLLDISMPELDGLGALSALREREMGAGQPPKPAIAVTANVMSHQVDAYLRAGFTTCLGKPFRRDDMVSAMMAALDNTGGSGQPP